MVYPLKNSCKYGDPWAPVTDAEVEAAATATPAAAIAAVAAANMSVRYSNEEPDNFNFNTKDDLENEDTASMAPSRG